MATVKNLRAVKDVMGALFDKDTDGAIDRASDSEEDVVLEGEEEPGLIFSAGDAANANKSENSNDSRERIGHPAKRRRSSLISQSKIPTPGPTGAAIEATSPLNSWDLLFSEKILDEIVTNTNEELGLKRLVSEATASYYHDVTREELKAFIGLLYFSGIHKTKDTNVEEMWSVTLGWTLYRATMPSKRFEILSTTLRFDDNATRNERREIDKFAPTRRVWELFLANCRKYYVPHEDCTIDELLIPFRGRCPFKLYISGESEKYGIKILALNDNQTFYVYDARPYTGKVNGNGTEPLLAHCIPKLSDSEKTINLKKVFHEYTTARKTSRWPMRIWMLMLDIGAINAMILHNFNTSNERMNRRKFLKTLTINLVEEHLRQRMVMPSLRRDLRFVIEKILNIDIPTDYRKTNLLEKRVRCNLCPRDKDRKTRHACYCCRLPICDEHRASVCADCCSRD